MLDQPKHFSLAAMTPIIGPTSVALLNAFAMGSNDVPSQLQMNEVVKLNGKNRMELEWKKEIKHYFKALRNYRGPPQVEKGETWLSIALGLLDLSKSVQNCQEVAPQAKSKIQRKDTVNSKIITIINQPPKSHEFLVLVLSHRTSEGKKQQISFDLELLIKTSRIIYKKINLKNWQEIHSEVERAKSLTENIVLLLQNKSKLKPLLECNLEMLNLINGFSDLQKSSTQRPLQTIQKSDVKIQQNRNQHQISNVVDRFQFIRESLLYALQVPAYASLNLNQVLALTLVHNVLTILPLATSRPLFPQIRTFCPSISRHMRREYDRHQSRNKSVALNQNHFPVHLQNAQNCWRCKSKRGYICCSTCSRTEGKNISLCLNCYENHHKQLNKSVGKSLSERQAASIYEQWLQVDFKVNLLIEQAVTPHLIKMEEKTI